MRRYLYYPALFLSGVAVACAAAFLGVFRSDGKLLDLSFNSNGTVASAAASRRASLSRSELPSADRDDERTNIEFLEVSEAQERDIAELSVGDLVSALDSDSLDALRVIRSEALQERKDYYAQVLPALKRKSLEQLLSRFERSDWEDWPRASYNKGGRPSSARLFVNSIQAVNDELGRYLETAALLLHRLYLASVQGKPYDLKNDFDVILEEAEEILAYMRKPAVASRTLLDLSILDDKAFLAALENTKGYYVAEYIRTRSDRVQSALDLLATVNPRMVGPEVNTAVVIFLKRMVMDASPAIRSLVIGEELRGGVLRRFATEDPLVKKYLAELFVVASLDELEASRKQSAARLLKESRTFAVGLPTQELVQDHLARETSSSRVKTGKQDPLANEADAPLEEMETASKNATDEVVPVAEAGESGGVGISWLTILLGIVLVGCGISFFVYRSHLRNLRAGEENFGGSNYSYTDSTDSEPFVLNDSDVPQISFNREMLPGEEENMAIQDEPQIGNLR